jgi:acetyltransferase-like isoleucine patch superfamily enzyme
VEIDVGCVFEGTVTLGDNVRIGAHCVIRNANIASGAVIHPFTHIEDAVVGPGALVGPFARLRPGAELGAEVHIGNFVEIKNSTLAAGAKANHLAYLGDATVGERVNYGAGSITANYDGANKHRTVIEADVHIGSNCVLVAPVTIGAGATIGGGSTQFGLGLVVQVHAQVDQRERVLAVHRQHRGVLPLGLAAGVAAGFDGTHQAFGQRLVGGGLEGGGHGLDHAFAGQHVAGHRVAVAHVVPGPGGVAIAGEGVRAAVDVDHVDLARLRVGVGRQQLRHDLFRRQRRRHQPPRHRQQVRVGHRLHRRRAALRHHHRAAHAHVGRVGGHGDAVFAGVRAARHDREGHRSLHRMPDSADSRL